MSKKTAASHDKKAVQPKICYTAAGILIQDKKVLLVKHKKLGIWLNPGGHIEGDELPHQAAEREFWEETGVRVTAYQPTKLLSSTELSEFIPCPIVSNVHWVCRENFAARSADPENFQPQAPWHRGCEQHLGFLYLMQPTDGVEFKQNLEETDGIAWFSPDEISELETEEDIKQEIIYAFSLLTPQ